MKDFCAITMHCEEIILAEFTRHLKTFENIFADDKTYLKVKLRSLSGKYRGAAHSKCTLRYSTTKGIPAVFHYG